MKTTRYQKIFITGALGFVGRALAEKYRALGAETCGLDVRADSALNIVAGDVSKPEDWQSALDGCDLVIHTAAIVTNNVSREDAWRVNVLGTRRVLDAAIRATAKRFIHISSLAAMRFNTDDQADESAPIMPTGNPYVDTKIASEHVVLAAHAKGEMTCTVIRPADIYGPGSRPWTLIPVRMIQKGLFLLPAHGKGIFRAIYIDDLVSGIMLAAEKDEGAGQILILGGEETITCETFFGHYYRMLGKGNPRVMSTSSAIAIAEIGRVLFKLLGKPTELGRGAMEMLSKKNTVSNQKAHDLLGWHPQVDLEEGMRRTEVWLRERKIL
ncbi:MAG: NAD-dependent epimerase/dehydratase family protein [Anaerolineales bacterium]|nr:NAD-dependent epimerase/dehydratase family protein [Anaerolineales bacterium]MCL4259789.1 NAD-dependent epimerase/dehydratase family protein [Anaerolineales bacterium]